MKDKDNKTSTVHKFTKAIPPRQEPDEDEARDAYDKAHAISRETLMLEVRLANGDTVSWPYSSLRKLKYSGKGVIELRFDGDVVIAEGRNMQRLKNAINEHQQRFLQEGTEIERGLKPEDAAHIERISIMDSDDEN